MLVVGLVSRLAMVGDGEVAPDIPTPLARPAGNRLSAQPR